MPRYKLTIEYDGTPFMGWQIQSDRQTVQGAIADAVKAFCGDYIIPFGAGRTDSGVHARGQVAHLDLSRDWPADTVRDALNAQLRPLPIAILDCTPVDPSFDARFSALQRRYRYEIVLRRAPLTLDRKRVWLVHQALDVAAMQEAATKFVGKHDFTTFRSVACQAKSPVKTVNSFEVVENRNRVTLTTTAKSFLHSQVRSMVGSLKLVGEGKWPASKISQILQAKDRSLCAALAPAHGLYLDQVDY